MSQHSERAKRSGLVKTVVLAGMVSAIVMGGASAKAEVCTNATARTALEMRVLQSELMVSALTCGQKTNYNAFITTFKPYLKKQGGQLRAFFTNAYGPKVGVQKMNQMVTRLANMASQNSVSGSTQAYCRAAQARFAKALKSSQKELALMARSNPGAHTHGFKTCVETANRDVAADETLRVNGVN